MGYTACTTNTLQSRLTTPDATCCLLLCMHTLAQASSMGIHGYWSSWQVPAREAPEMQQLLGLDISRGDRCLGFFLVGTADAERLQSYRPKRQPLSEKVVWMS